MSRWHEAKPKKYESLAQDMIIKATPPKFCIRSRGLVGECKTKQIKRMSCPICLGEFNRRSLIQNCHHSFCFSCIVEWSRVSSQCPLCKGEMGIIIHGFEVDRLEKYQLEPPAANSDTSESTAFTQRQILITTEDYYRSTRHLAIPRRSRANRRSTSPVRPAEQQHLDAMQRRRDIYAQKLWVKHMGTNEHSRFRPPVTPEFLQRSPSVAERLRPWIRRDLQALTREFDVELILHYVEGMMRRYPLQSALCLDRLRLFLHDETEHFVHELLAFSRSPFDISTYDAQAQYSSTRETVDE
eukprot:Partr_v1_DN19343_c0_g1_i1_m57757 putative topoisomerase I binding, arginine serine-rich, E3 ubiquitin protein ligase